MKAKKIILLAVLVAFSFCAKAQVTTIDSGTCGANLTWILTSDSTLTISGSGNMTDFDYLNPVPWHNNPYQNLITTVVIGDSVTSVGDYAFGNCYSLSSVTIGNGVTSIGNSAFYLCKSLTSVTIPNSVTSIGQFAFAACFNLTSITIPDSVTTIESSTFSTCTSLTSVTIPNGVIVIGNSAFDLCGGLTSITIPNSVTTIGGGAFYYCSGLISVTLGNNVMTIGDVAFRSCYSLTSITIPNSVTSIGDVAFHYCDALTSITLGNSVTTIGDGAFARCESLTSITILAVIPPALGVRVFEDVPDSIPVYIPCGSKSAYQDSAGWNYFTNYIELMDTTFITDTVCSGVIYNNYGFNILAVAGVHHRTDSCSTTCLTLTTYPSVPMTQYADALCFGETYNDANFTNLTKDSIYYDTLKNINGCDSVVEFTLSYYPSVELTQYADTLCYGEIYNDANFSNLTQTGTYYDTLQNINGCDSIIKLTLTVNFSDTTEIDATIYEGEVYRENGFNDSVAGTHTQILQNINGCDSLVILNLTVSVGIVETHCNASLRVYPNPTTGELIVDIADQARNDIWNVEIYDVVGRKIFSLSERAESEVIIDVSHLQSGIYVMKVYDINKQVSIFKIIKK